MFNTTLAVTSNETSFDYEVTLAVARNETSSLDYEVTSTDNATFFNYNNTEENIDEYIASLVQKFALSTYGQHYKICFPITFVVCCVGLVTNVFNAVVFTRKNMINAINFFLAALSIADLFLLATQLPYSVHYFQGFGEIFGYHWNRFYITLVFAETATLTLCNWLVVFIGVWRFVAIQWPLKTAILCSMSRAKKAVATLTLLSLLISLPIYAVLTNIEYNIKSRTLYAKGFSEFANENPGLLEAYWGGLTVVAFIPCVLMVTVTCLLIWRLLMLRSERAKAIMERKSSMRNQDAQSNKITLMLIVLLVLFVLNNLPDSCILLAATFSHGNEEVQMASKNATDILRMFSMVNNSFSFFIYYVMSANFRRAFQKYFISCLYEDRPSSVESNLTVSEYSPSQNNSVGDIPLATTKNNVQCH